MTNKVRFLEWPSPLIRFLISLKNKWLLITWKKPSGSVLKYTNVVMSGFMKTVSENSLPNQEFFFSRRWRYKNWLKEPGVSLFSPPLVYLPFIAVLSLFFLFYMAWRLPLGVVKSNWNMGDWEQIIDTVLIIQS